MTMTENSSENQGRRNTRSIKRQAALWYTYLYLIIATVTVAVLCISIFSYADRSVNEKTEFVKKDIEQRLSKEGANSDPGKILKSIETEDPGYEIALIDSKGRYYLGSENEAIKEYLTSLDDNVMFNISPRFSLLYRGYLVGGRRLETPASGNDSLSYRMLTFYPAASVIAVMEALVPPVSVILVLGAFAVMILGRMKLGRMLAPINQMNSTTRRITAENLDLRLDVESAEYELKELAQTTNEMIDSFQSAYEQQEQFVSDVSHELRTPISVISGYANMIKRWGAEDEEVLDEAVDSIIFETENMKDLVNKLLILARHDRNSLNYSFETVDLSQSVELIIRDMRVTNPEITIIDSIEKNVFIIADELRIIEAIRVFTDNAVKYSKEDPVIEISLLKRENSAILTVKDNGIGMSSEELPKIFNRFYRSEKSRNKETGGTGLGLSIAKVIIADHNGNIKVRSKENAGSEFIITLPAVSEEN